jgi:hypothetical protein
MTMQKFHSSFCTVVPHVVNQCVTPRQPRTCQRDDAPPRPWRQVAGQESRGAPIQQPAQCGRAVHLTCRAQHEKVLHPSAHSHCRHCRPAPHTATPTGAAIYIIALIFASVVDAPTAAAAVVSAADDVDWRCGGGGSVGCECCVFLLLLCGSGYEGAVQEVDCQGGQPHVEARGVQQCECAH